jgi:hypothetical protein
MAMSRSSIWSYAEMTAYRRRPSSQTSGPPATLMSMWNTCAVYFWQSPQSSVPSGSSRPWKQSSRRGTFFHISMDETACFKAPQIKRAGPLVAPTRVMLRQEPPLRS